MPPRPTQENGRARPPPAGSNTQQHAPARAAPPAPAPPAHPISHACQHTSPGPPRPGDGDARKGWRVPCRAREICAGLLGNRHRTGSDLRVGSVDRTPFALCLASVGWSDRKGAGSGSRSCTVGWWWWWLVFVEFVCPCAQSLFRPRGLLTVHAFGHCGSHISVAAARGDPGRPDELRRTASLRTDTMDDGLARCASCRQGPCVGAVASFAGDGSSWRGGSPSFPNRAGGNIPGEFSHGISGVGERASPGLVCTATCSLAHARKKRNEEKGE